MPIVIPPGFAQVHCLFRSGVTGQPTSNVYGVDLAAPLDQASVDSRSTAIGGAYKNILDTGSVFDGIHVVEGQDGAPLIWDSVAGAQSGTRALTNMATPQVQFMCEKKTTLGGRKFRGRSFHIDVAEADVADDGTVAAGTVTILQTFCTALLANFGGGAFAGIVLLHTDATLPTPVTTYKPDAKVSTLRGRYRR